MPVGLPNCGYPTYLTIAGKKACIGHRHVLRQRPAEQAKRRGLRSLCNEYKGWTHDKRLIIEIFPKVFGPGVGCLKGEYHIQLDPQCSTVQHAPRRVHVAFRDCLKEKLDQLVEEKTLAPVTEPIPWITSMVAVPKSGGRLEYA